MSATFNGQVWLPNKMVKMGGKARGKPFPQPPSAFHLPAPPPLAVAQLTSSWGKDASPLVAPPEAQGARDARPEAPPFCRLLPNFRPLLPNFSPSREVKEGGQCRA